MAQNQLCREIMDVTTSQCTELHEELINLRLSTKQELTRLQGSLQVSPSLLMIILNIIFY